MTDGVKIKIDFEEVNKSIKQLSELKEVLRQVAEDAKKGFKINNFGDSINARKQGKLFQELEDRIKSLEQQLEDAKNRAVDFGEAASEAAEGASDSFESLRLGVSGLVASFLSIAGISIGMKMANDFGQLESRLKAVVKDEEDFIYVQQQLMEITGRTYKPLEQQYELFLRSASSMEELGYSTRDTVGFIDSISSSLTINSASADRANLAIAALNRSMTKGKVAAQEWEMIMNVMPTIAADIATYLRETGRAAEATEMSVKRMASEGEISTQLLMDSALHVKEAKAAMAEEMPTTKEDANMLLLANLKTYLNDLDKTTKATESYVEVVKYLSKNIDDAAKLVGSILAGALTVYTLKTLGATYATTRSTYAKIADTIAESNAAKAEVARTATILAQTRAQLGLTTTQAQLTAATNAHTVAQTRAVAASTAMRSLMTGGLIGLAGLAVTLGTAAASWLLFKDNTELAKNALDDAAKSIDEVRRKIYEMTEAQLNKYIIEVKAAVKVEEDDVNKVIKQIENKIPTQMEIASEAEFTVYKDNKDVITAFEDFKKLREETGNTAKAMDFLIARLEALGVLDDKMREDLTVLAGKLDEENDKLVKQVSILEEAEGRKAELSEQNKEAAAANVALKNKTRELNDEIKKLTKSFEDQYNSGIPVEDIIASMEARLEKLRDTAGNASNEVNDLSKALDKLKSAKASLDNQKDTDFIKKLAEDVRTQGMTKYDLDRERIQKSGVNEEEKQRAYDLIAQKEQFEKQQKSLNESSKSGKKSVNDSENYVKGLEKEAAQLKLTKQEIKERELAEKNLSGEMLARAQIAMSIIDADEKQRQEMANANDNLQLQINLYRNLGDEATASLLDIESRYKKLREEFTKNGNTEGIKLSIKAEGVEKFKANLDTIKSEVNKFFTDQAREEQSIEAQVTAGLISRYEAQKRLAELHARTVKSVSTMVPQLKEMAKLEGEMGDQARDYLTEIQTRATELIATTNELENALRNGLQDGIQSSIDGLVRGTMDLQEATKNFIDSIASNILNVITQNIAQQAADGVMSGLNNLNTVFGFGVETPDLGIEESPQALAINSASQEGALAMQLGIEQGAITAAQTLSAALNGGGVAGLSEGMSTLGGEGGLFGNVTQQASEAVGAISTVKAAKTAADASLTASAAASAASTQATTTAAAAAAQTSWAAPAASAATATMGGAVMMALPILLMAITSLKAFKTGGHVLGAGTGTSDSIPARLSNGEFVTRAAVVKQPGMLDFMKDLNARGWAALDERRIAYHSTGGLAGMPEISAPSLPSINLSPAESTSSTTVKNNMTLNVVKDPNEIGDSFLNNPHTKDQFIVFLTENSQTIKQILQS